jgi:hypothetical protein
MLSKSGLGNYYSFYKEHQLLQHRVKKKVVYHSDICYGISEREEINMQEGSLNRDDMTRKNDYWVELDRKYRAQVRKTRCCINNIGIYFAGFFPSSLCMCESQLLISISWGQASSHSRHCSQAEARFNQSPALQILVRSMLLHKCHQDG